VSTIEFIWFIRSHCSAEMIERRAKSEANCEKEKKSEKEKEIAVRRKNNIVRRFLQGNNAVNRTSYIAFFLALTIQFIALLGIRSYMEREKHSVIHGFSFRRFRVTSSFISLLPGYFDRFFLFFTSGLLRSFSRFRFRGTSFVISSLPRYFAFPYSFRDKKRTAKHPVYTRAGKRRAF
jgi:hypothetical protein